MTEGPLTFGDNFSPYFLRETLPGSVAEARGNLAAALHDYGLGMYCVASL